jgi:hypothetical protein
MGGYCLFKQFLISRISDLVRSISRFHVGTNQMQNGLYHLSHFDLSHLDFHHHELHHLVQHHDLHYIIVIILKWL